MKKKNLLIVLPYLDSGGLERMILNLCTYLSLNSEWNPILFVFERENGTIAEEFKKNHIEVVFYKKKKGFDVNVSRKIKYLVKERDIQIVHTHDLGAAIYGVFAKIISFFSFRLVNTQHSFIHLKKNNRYELYEKICSLFYDKLVVVSESLKETFQNIGINTKDIQLIFNGIPEKKFDDKRSDVLILNESLNNQAEIEKVLDKKWILHLARVNKDKGQDTTLKYWLNLSSDERSQLALFIIGQASDVEYFNSLKEMIHHHKIQENTFLLGETTTPEKWHQSADLFISASNFEGMPLAPLEAIFAGKQTLLSDIPGHKMYGDQAVLFDLNQEQNPLREMFFSKNSEMYFDKKRLFELSQKYKKKFSVEKMAGDYIEIYNHLAK